MSRLDSFIRRMSAQRDLLNALPAGLGDVPGLVLEFGLGNGRTYDHLRERFPDRRILVLERAAGLAATPRPPPGDLLLGDIRDTARHLSDGSAALIHADIKVGEPTQDAALQAWLPALVARLLAPGGFAVCSGALPDDRLVPCALPPGVPEERYRLFQRRA